MAGKNKADLLLTPRQVRELLPRRHPAAHKGQNGHVLIIAGSRGMGGAAVLATLGALRAGAGLVTTAIVASERPMVAGHVIEAMTLPLPETADGILAADAIHPILRLLEERRISVIAAGPGLRLSSSVAAVLRELLKLKPLPLVLDADALNNLAPSDVAGHGSVIITPHPGELARFQSMELAAVQNDRSGIASRTARELGGVCVLKGHHTVISDGRRTVVNPTGNPAMASGGMGDVLTGAIAGLVAQQISLFDAASAGVFLHGMAGDVARESDRGLLASDLARSIPAALRRIGVSS